MPGLTHCKSATVSLVQDQVVELVPASSSDLTITIIGAADEEGIKHVTDVFASKKACMNSSYLQSSIIASDDPSEITLGGELKRSASKKYGNDGGENREGLLVMLAHLHGLTEPHMEDLGLYSISILGLWHAIAYMELNQANTAKSALKPWFEKWYAASMERVELNVDSARGLAFPTQLFDHALGFASVTKWLAYNHVGHVNERPPKGFHGHRDLHLSPGDFVGM